MTDLQAAGVGVNDDPVDDQLEDGALVSQGRRVQPSLKAVDEGGKAAQHLLRLAMPLPPPLLLGALPLEGIALLPELPASRGELGQIDYLGLVGIEQACLLALEPAPTCGELLVGPVRDIVIRASRDAAGELRRELGRVTEQTDHMLPDRGLQLRRLNGAGRADALASAHDAVLAVAAIAAPFGLPCPGLVGPAEHGQAAGAARQQAP